MGFLKSLAENGQRLREEEEREEKEMAEFSKLANRLGGQEAARLQQEADSKAKARFKMEQETDPLKKMMMEERINNGIYNFSDL